MAAFEILVNGEIVEQVIRLKHETDVLFVKLVAVLHFHVVDAVIEKVVLAAPLAVEHSGKAHQLGLTQVLPRRSILAVVATVEPGVLCPLERSIKRVDRELAGLRNLLGRRWGLSPGGRRRQKRVRAPNPDPGASVVRGCRGDPR